ESAGALAIRCPANVHFDNVTISSTNGKVQEYPIFNRPRPTRHSVGNRSPARPIRQRQRTTPNVAVSMQRTYATFGMRRRNSRAPTSRRQHLYGPGFGFSCQLATTVSRLNRYVASSAGTRTNRPAGLLRNCRAPEAGCADLPIHLEIAA